MTIASQPGSNRGVVVVLALILAGYLALAWGGWPQQATAKIAAQASHAVTEDSGGGSSSHGAELKPHPPFWMALPFALLLICIAVCPLIPGVSHWWESNLHKCMVAGGLGVLTLLYYLLVYRQPVAGHWPFHYLIEPAAAGLNWFGTGTVVVNAMGNEYIPFIVLLFSLFTIVGGIRVEGDIPAHPLTNTAFLGIGALLASLIGTTGASMLLIRPLLETNRERKHVRHTVIMFIFVVCNCGGCLLPLGDPPLFLGYLFGVPFLWTLRLWPAWLMVNGLLLGIYYVWDRFGCYRHEGPFDLSRDETEIRPLCFRGLWPNALLLGGVILTVGLLDPAKPVPGTDWHPWVYLREAAQLGLVLLSLVLGSSAIRRDNDFNYGPILEVAVLFLGIFLCMQPPLEVLHVRGPSLGLASPAHFFWATGSLSSVLDNAPTYAVFFETAKSLGGEPAVAGVRESLLVAVSLGAVFMGAMTYIGNGPNFMVKSIAEKSGVKMPSFFGYVVYSVAILLPLFALVALVFL
jgi:Na+/H+ antiporter NhaD/arsenite permease-like protein